MDTNALVNYLDIHNAEYEEWYEISREKYLRVANSLCRSLSNYNITVLDPTKFNSLLRVIETFLNKNEIFEEWKNVRSLIDFILLNLAVKNEGEQKLFTSKLLGLLVHILERTKPIHSKNFLDKKQILDTLSLLLTDDMEIALTILKILDNILKMEGALTYNINNLVDVIISLLFYRGDMKNMCLMAKFIIRWLSQIDEKNVRQIFQWVFEKSASFIKLDDTDVELKKEILSLILDLQSENACIIKDKYPSYQKDIKNLWVKFMCISDRLWVLCKNDNSISCLAQEVFNLTVLQFLIAEKMMNCNEESILKDMRLFHMDPDDDQEYPEQYFFFICHMQETYSRLTWSPKTILRGMNDWFYNKRSKIDGPILKSLLFLYPRLAISFFRPDYIAWSREILEMVLTYPFLPEILSFCPIQFAWILKMGHHSLKIETLRLWINEPQHYKVMRNVITLCRAERLLLNLIVEDCDRKTGRMASKFLQKTANEELSKEIARMLPFSSKEPNVFNCLILANPGIPEKIEEKMLLLQVISVMIPSLADDTVLRSACMYSNNLLEDMKREPKCLEAFSKYSSTIKFLIYATYRTEEDISKEILFLFRNLASIQVKYQIELKCTIETDPMMFLRGSTRQINRVLKIFPIILCAKVDPLLKFKNGSILTLFYQMLNFVEDKDTQENALKCLHLLIRSHDWLSFSSGIGSFMKLWCCERLATERSRIFMVLIILWLKKLIKYPKFLHPDIPFTEIQNFFMRNGDTGQLNHCSKILAILQAEKCFDIKDDGSIRTLSDITIL